MSKNADEHDDDLESEVDEESELETDHFPKTDDELNGPKPSDADDESADEDPSEM